MLTGPRRDGDESAFRALYERHAPDGPRRAALARVAAGRGHLMQDVFLAAWRALHQFAPTSTWAPGFRHRAARGEPRAPPCTPRCRASTRCPTARPSRFRPPRPPRRAPPPTMLATRCRAARDPAPLPDAYRETLAMRLVEGLSGPRSPRPRLTHGPVRVNSRAE